MEAVNDDDEAMMAMMGLNGFGSTKVSSAFTFPAMSSLQSILLALLGPARRWEPGWRRPSQEAANMETVHEQVFYSIMAPPILDVDTLCRRGGFNRPLDKIK